MSFNVEKTACSCVREFPPYGISEENSIGFPISVEDRVNSKHTVYNRCIFKFYYYKFSHGLGLNRLTVLHKG